MSATSVINWIESTQVYGSATKQVPALATVTGSAKNLADGLDANIKIVSEAANLKNIQEAVVSTVANNTKKVREFATAKVPTSEDLARVYAVAKENAEHSVSRIQQSIDSVPQVKSKVTAFIAIVLAFLSKVKAYSDMVPEVVATYRKDHPVLESNAIFATILMLICTLFATLSSIIAKVLPSPSEESASEKLKQRKKKQGSPN